VSHTVANIAFAVIGVGLAIFSFFITGIRGAFYAAKSTADE
jgi:hypothetical protein